MQGIVKESNREHFYHKDYLVRFACENHFYFFLFF